MIDPDLEVYVPTRLHKIMFVHDNYCWINAGMVSDDNPRVTYIAAPIKDWRTVNIRLMAIFIFDDSAFHLQVEAIIDAWFADWSIQFKRKARSSGRVDDWPSAGFIA